MNNKRMMNIRRGFTNDERIDWHSRYKLLYRRAKGHNNTNFRTLVFDSPWKLNYHYLVSLGLGFGPSDLHEVLLYVENMNQGRTNLTTKNFITFKYISHILSNNHLIRLYFQRLDDLIKSISLMAKDFAPIFHELMDK
ncbi:hypothetical protein YC2023_035729 [Brassica napus]